MSDILERNADACSAKFHSHARSSIWGARGEVEMIRHARHEMTSTTRLAHAQLGTLFRFGEDNPLRFWRGLGCGQRQMAMLVATVGVYALT